VSRRGPVDDLAGLGLDVNPAAIATLIRNPSNIADLLCETTETGDSPAEIMADIFNFMRADIARVGRVHDVEVEIDLMTAERAAELLAGVVAGDGVALVEAFNAEADRRDAVLRAALDESEYESHEELKTSIRHTGDDEITET
jgi:hypothetical protein